MNITPAFTPFAQAERFLTFGLTILQTPQQRWVVAACLFALTYMTYKGLTYKGKLPPGPRGLPFFGNMFQLDEENWKTFTRWKEEYGPIVHLNFAGQSVVVLNTHKVAADLLDRRAGIYSDRPRWIMASEILTGGLLVVFTGYGQMWRRMRRAAHEGLNMRVAKDYYAIQTKEAAILADGLLKEPNSWDDHLRRTAASTILAAVYDAPPIHSIEHPLIVRINDLAQRLVHAGYPGNYLVEFFPWMKKLPNWMAKWKAWGEEWHRKDSAMLEGYYSAVKKRVLAGDTRPSFAASLASTQDRHGFTDRESSWLAGTMVSAGAETTAAVLAWFMLAMVLYPETQKKAQAELDAVVGRSRLPTFADFDHLPYIRAMVKETLRWRAVDPLGLQHRSIEDDWYEGYYIPKGSVIMANVWAMNRDPEVHGTDYDFFNPSRYLNDKGELDSATLDTKDEGHVTFGFGRRICVGRHVANNSLFIDIATILWSCTLAPKADVNGIWPTQEKSLNEGLVVRPQPFDIDMKARHPDAQTIVDQTKDMLACDDLDSQHKL